MSLAAQRSSQVHARFVDSLAVETQRSVEDVLPLYEEALALLAIGAQIDDYLPVFVCKRVKRILSGRAPLTMLSLV